jgi:hypothetical protein
MMLRSNEDETTIHANRPFSLSPALERAKASRPSKLLVVVQQPAAKPASTQPASAVAASTPAEVTDYDSLLKLLRARADELQISRSTLDHISGLPDGFSAKLLSLNKLRRIGMQSLGPMLDALCLRLVAVPDVAAFERNRSRMVKRDDPHFRSASARHKKKFAFEKISGTVTATLGSAERYVAPMRFENLSGAVTAKMFGYSEPA